jgi:hypothetical protein
LTKPSSGIDDHFTRRPRITQALWALKTREDMLGHPAAGASWETFCASA